MSIFLITPLELLFNYSLAFSLSLSLCVCACVMFVFHFTKFIGSQQVRAGADYGTDFCKGIVKREANSNSACCRTGANTTASVSVDGHFLCGREHASGSHRG